MRQNNSLKLTVKTFIILVSIVCTNAKAQLAPVGLEARIITFFNKDAGQVQAMNQIKANNENWLIQKEQQKHWNTTPGQLAINSDANQQKMVVNAMIKNLSNPLKNNLKQGLNQTTQAMIEDFQESQMVLNDKNGKNLAVNGEEKVRFNWKVQPDRLKARLGAQYKELSTEVHFQVNGKREIASAHSLSELGVTSRVSYRFDTQTTITSLDKKITDHVVGRISQSLGNLNESKAEVVYSHSF
jgi:hypothetical protein